MKWHPMDTAPVDGTRVLVTRADGLVCFASIFCGEWQGDDDRPLVPVSWTPAIAPDWASVYAARAAKGGDHG